MRKIKYRGWSKDRNKMIDDYINVEVGRDSANSGASRTYTSVTTYTNSIIEDIIPMQYTGLKDKNGKEVYEGDIVKCPVTINKHMHGDYTNRVVKWKEDSFTWVFDGDYAWGRFEDFVTEDGDYLTYTEDGKPVVNIEIIGNIHENPELLKND